MNDRNTSNRFVSIEKLKYKKDQIAFLFAILGLFTNVLYFFTLYKNNNNFYYSWKMGISIIYNLLFMLFVFLSAEEVKNYHRSFSVMLVIIGILQFVRIFIYPTQAFNAEVLPDKPFLLIKIYLVLSCGFLITSGLESFIRSTILKRFIQNTNKIQD